MNKWCKKPSHHLTICFNCKHHQYKEYTEVLSMREAGQLGFGSDGVYYLYPYNAKCEYYNWSLKDILNPAHLCQEFEHKDGYKHWSVHKKYYTMFHIN